MLKYERVDQNNVGIAIAIQNTLFPEENGRMNYEEAINGITDFQYYLVVDEDGSYVGISGLYHYPVDAESAWLGWFGIKEEYRRRHYGSQTIALFEQLARDQGYRYARLYTDEHDNDEAIQFYLSIGYTCEKYKNEDDPASLKLPLLIFSKSLYGGCVTPWNNRNIDFTSQARKQWGE